MKAKFVVPIFVLGLLICCSFTLGGKKITPITVGSKAPLADVLNEDVSGKKVSLKEVLKENGLLVIFSCNTCPFVVGTSNKDGWEGRYNSLFELCDKNSMGMALINSNEAKRNGDDSLEEMKKHASKEKYKSVYLLDKNSEMANAFGAKTTPHVFLFDKDLKLVYEGAIDDNCNDAKKVENDWLKNAMLNLVKNKPIDPNDTDAVGCGIKRVKS